MREFLETPTLAQLRGGSPMPEHWLKVSMPFLLPNDEIAALEDGIKTLDKEVSEATVSQRGEC